MKHLFYEDVTLRSLRSASSSIALATLMACHSQTAEQALPDDTVSITAWAAQADTLVGEYSRVVRPAEFWDSILVVPDVRERILWKLNLVSGDRAPFGTRGRGPGEYPMVSWAVKVHRDSVAIVQGWTSSPFPVLSVSSGRGRTHQSRPTVDGTYANAADQPRFFFGDTLGHLYATSVRYSEDLGKRSWPAEVPLAAVPTSPLLRLSIRNANVDTIGYVPVALKAPEIGTSKVSGVEADAGPYSPFNSWFTLADGRSVLANGGSYVLETMQATGALEGPWTVEYPTLSASAEGYEAYAERNRRMTAALMRSALTRANVSQAPPARELVLPKRPAHLPPLNFAGVREMHGFDDIVWIPVHVQDPPKQEVWDLVNIVSRKRECRVALGGNERLLLVTANGAYVAVLDEWDLERIVRYRSSDRGCPQ